jgi:hypothetical protein
MEVERLSSAAKEWKRIESQFLWERFNVSEFTRETEFTFRFAIQAGARERAGILYTAKLSKGKLF